MLSSTIIAYIFRILNFAVLIGVIVYLFKRYALDMIYEQMNEKEAHMQGLDEQKRMLIWRIHELNRSIESQELRGKKLVEKVDQWHAHYQKIIAQHEQEHKKNAERIGVHRQLRAEHIVQELMEREIFPEVLKEVRQTVIEKFSHASENNHFIEKLVEQINKRH